MNTAFLVLAVLGITCVECAVVKLPWTDSCLAAINRKRQGLDPPIQPLESLGTVMVNDANKVIDAYVNSNTTVCKVPESSIALHGGGAVVAGLVDQATDCETIVAKWMEAGKTNFGMDNPGIWDRENPGKFTPDMYGFIFTYATPSEIPLVCQRTEGCKDGNDFYVCIFNSVPIADKTMPFSNQLWTSILKQQGLITEPENTGKSNGATDDTGEKGNTSGAVNIRPGVLAYALGVSVFIAGLFIM